MCKVAGRVVVCGDIVLLAEGDRVPALQKRCAEKPDLFSKRVIDLTGLDSYMTPHSVNYGHARVMREGRQAALDAAFLANPKRVKIRRPQPSALPTAAWINPPPPETVTPQST